MTLDTEHLGANIIVRTEQRLVGPHDHRRRPFAGRQVVVHADEGWRPCDCGKASEPRGRKCKYGHAPEERKLDAQGKSFCHACQQQRDRQRRRSKAA